MNSTWWSAVNGDGSGEDLELQVRRYLASRSLAMVLQGVPDIYAHGAIGSSNDHELARRTNVRRDVNRAAIDVGRIAEEVTSPGSRVGLLASRWPALGLTRTRERAFHPHGAQRVVMTAPQVFAVLRTSPEGDRHVLAMTNVSRSVCAVAVPLSELRLDASCWHDAIGGQRVQAESGALRITLQPYDVVWLQPGGQTTGGVVDR